MNNNLEALKAHLNGLTFARVRITFAKDDDLISFVDKRGLSNWGEDPDFMEKRREFRREEWNNADKAYRFYFGFAESTAGGDVHFSSKNHSYQNESFCGLGVSTNQEALNPPTRGTLIVGNVARSGKPHFCRWARCSEAERHFAEFLLKNKTRFSADDLRRLSVSRHISEGKNTNYLIDMAMLLLARDLEYFLGHRERHGSDIDERVHDICSRFDQSLWDEYEERALDLVRKHANPDPRFSYSTWIPQPAPTPISDSIRSEKPAPFRLLTPFHELKLSS